MKRIFAQTFLAVGFLLFLSQGTHAYGINTLREVDLPIGADGNQALLITTLPQTSEATAKTATYTGARHSVLDTSGTASLNEAGIDVDSTGTGNGTNAINTGPVDNATGGTTNDAATFSGGNVEIGTTGPATRLKARINGPVKAAGTGSEACTASDLGAMRYNSTGQYVEICTGP